MKCLDVNKLRRDMALRAEILQAQEALDARIRASAKRVEIHNMKLGIEQKIKELYDARR